jgi:hypothetical protein
MNKIFLTALAGLMATLAVAATATATPQKNAKAKAATQFAEDAKKLKTDHSFNDASIHGRYQYADEGTVTVENEKSLIDLLGMRRHFKDRFAAEKTRN